ncbi:MAG: SMP-30/gluconolactonase/LRE family protein [Steroidobacteraceae bacterium]
MSGICTRLIVLTVTLLASGLAERAFSATALPTQEPNCAPENGLNFLCGPLNIEDMVTIPGHNALIGSSGRAPDAPVGAPVGKLYFIDTKARAFVQLVPDVTGMARQEYSACPSAPDMSAFSPHGIGLRAGVHEQHLLYVVNHGGREAIELFALDASRTPVSLTWVGCVVLPEGGFGNGVAPLADGGFVATKFLDKRHGDMLSQFSIQEKTGAVYRWHPGQGITELPGGDLSGNNGIETSADGKWVFVNVWPEKRVVRFALDGHAPISIPLDFMPDNIHRAPDGSLLIAGQDTDIPTLWQHFSTNTPIDWVVVRLDPKTLRVSPLLREKGTSHFDNVSGAAQIGNVLWLGPVHGDRVASKSLP